jgi:hypothetical protein
MRGFLMLLSLAMICTFFSFSNYLLQVIINPTLFVAVCTSHLLHILYELKLLIKALTCVSDTKLCNACH